MKIFFSEKWKFGKVIFFLCKSGKFEKWKSDFFQKSLKVENWNSAKMDKLDRPTDKRTDRRLDGQTDGQTDS